MVIFVGLTLSIHVTCCEAEHEHREQDSHDGSHHHHLRVGAPSLAVVQFLERDAKVASPSVGLLPISTDPVEVLLLIRQTGDRNPPCPPASRLYILHRALLL